MASVHTLRHTTALRALLGMAPEPVGTSPAPGFEGPAVWAGPSGELRANANGDALYDASGGLESRTAALVGDVRSAQAPRMAETAVERPDGRVQTFALTGIPHDGGVLVLAKETTRLTAQIASLKASREMFRDVTLCAGGFAFETTGKGVVAWTGPGKPLGYAAESMIGRAARDFVAPQSPDAFDPFSAREIIEDLPVWANSFDQGPRALRVSVRPYFGPNGEWRGVRGHARDETFDIRRIRSERFTQTAVEAMRAEPSPEQLLETIAGAAAEACLARAAWLFCVEPGPNCVQTQGGPPCELTTEIARRTLADGVQYPSLFTAGAWTGLAMALKAQGETQAALLVAQQATTEDLSHDMHEMLRLIAPQASIAALHARMTARLQSQSTVDPLTRLFDANGWRACLETRLRNKSAGHVLAIECDRFQAFADGLGRAASDELLIEIAARLKALSGPSEFCARLGESSFALWVDGAGRSSAQSRADAVAEAFRIASRRMSLALAATPNIGLAQTSEGPEAETAAALTERAFLALAAAKRGPRSRGAASCSNS